MQQSAARCLRVLAAKCTTSSLSSQLNLRGTIPPLRHLSNSVITTAPRTVYTRCSGSFPSFSTFTQLRSFSSLVNSNSIRMQTDDSIDSESDSASPSRFSSVTKPMCATVGQVAPDFTASGVVSGELKSEVSLSSFRGKYVVLLFYPSDFTFVCPTELVAFANQYHQFQNLNCEVLAISVDSQFAHLAWEHISLNDGGIGRLPYPLLSDSSRAISSAYNVLLPEQGIDLRATFILDEKGVVRSLLMNDVQVGRSVEEILRLVQAFQYSDVHGKVMPCDWKPGQEAIKAEPVAAAGYFKNLKIGDMMQTRQLHTERQQNAQNLDKKKINRSKSSEDEQYDENRSVMSGQN